MGEINTGKINKEGDFVKYVKFSKAVLWKDREISLPPEVVERIIKNKAKQIIFVDLGKKEVWGCKTQKWVDNAYLKQEGQESQYYMSIDLLTRKKIDEGDS